MVLNSSADSLTHTDDLLRVELRPNSPHNARLCHGHVRCLLLWRKIMHGTSLGKLFLGSDHDLGEEPSFSSAMSRYYDDTVACMGALQIVPTFLQS